VVESGVELSVLGVLHQEKHDGDVNFFLLTQASSWSNFYVFPSTLLDLLLLVYIQIN